MIEQILTIAAVSAASVATGILIGHAVGWIIIIS